MSQMGIGGVLEFFGGLLLILGLFTRPVAFILSGMMAVAYFQVHAPGGFWPLQNRGELAVLYCFVFLFLAVAGGGEWSLDRLLRRSSHTPLAGVRT
jgi:putative oxidoreductase